MFSKEKVSLLLPTSVIALTVSLSNSLLQIPPKKFRDSIINDRTTSYIIYISRKITKSIFFDPCELAMLHSYSYVYVILLFMCVLFLSSLSNLTICSIMSLSGYYYEISKFRVIIFLPLFEANRLHLLIYWPTSKFNR